jgi:hypothetical protein
LKVRSYIQLALLSGAICYVSAGCNNYGLLDKLANPGSGSDGYYAFVTSITTDGQLGFLFGGAPQVPSCNGTGIANATCVCNALAKTQTNLASRTYVPWLSTSVLDMTCRMQGIDSNNCAFGAGHIWHNTADEVIARDLSDLFDGNLSAALKYDEFKNGQAGNVWTGTDANGLRANTGMAADTCSDWTLTGGTARAGDIGITAPNWSNNTGAAACANPLRIYCFAIK